MPDRHRHRRRRRHRHRHRSRRLSCTRIASAWGSVESLKATGIASSGIAKIATRNWQTRGSRPGERRGGDRNPGRQSGSIKLTWPSASLPNYEGAAVRIPERQSSTSTTRRCHSNLLARLKRFRSSSVPMNSRPNSAANSNAKERFRPGGSVTEPGMEDVRFWHKADMLNELTNIRFRGQSRHLPRGFL